MGMITDHAKPIAHSEGRTVDDHGFDSLFTEAELMAVLAQGRHNLPITFPDTTGVGEPLSGGMPYAKVEINPAVH